MGTQIHAWGGAVVIAPDGKVLKQGGAFWEVVVGKKEEVEEEAEVVVARCGMGWVERWRGMFPLCWSRVDRCNFSPGCLLRIVPLNRVIETLAAVDSSMDFDRVTSQGVDVLIR